ncbi:hypothetical protein [Halobaculum sp. EA56]|uniref:hypothetical protein n=1 Tax=Halobaculum sp. EA56 TaxID=3421648 RepID=UPI003EB9905F
MLLAVTLATTLALTAATSNAASQPTVAVGSATVDTGDRTTLAVTLSSAPDGLSGYSVFVTVSDPSTGLIVDASIPTFGIQNATVLDDATAELRAVDIIGRVDSGASDVPLGTVTILASAPGEMTVSIVTSRIDTDRGDPLHPRTTNATVIVREDSRQRADRSVGNTSRMPSTTPKGPRGLTNPAPILGVCGAVTAVIVAMLLAARPS